MNEVLEQIADIIDQYKDTDTNNGIELNRQLKELTARLYYLETIRTMAHEKYEATIHMDSSFVSNLLSFISK